MGRVFNAESKQRISTSLLYCAKSSDATPPASGWKILRDGKKPAPKIKELKNSASPRPAKENKVTPFVLVEECPFFLVKVESGEHGDRKEKDLPTEGFCGSHYFSTTISKLYIFLQNFMFNCVNVQIVEIN